MKRLATVALLICLGSNLSAAELSRPVSTETTYAGLMSVVAKSIVTFGALVDDEVRRGGDGVQLEQEIGQFARVVGLAPDVPGSCKVALGALRASVDALKQSMADGLRFYLAQRATFERSSADCVQLSGAAQVLFSD